MSDTSEEKCWLCLRTSPKSILEVSHKLFPYSPELAHRIGMFAAELLRKAYFKNPPALCGRKTNALIGGALYLVCLQNYIACIQKDETPSRPPTQREVAEVIEMTESSVRSSYQLVARTLGILQDWPEKYRYRVPKAEEDAKIEERR